MRAEARRAAGAICGVRMSVHQANRGGGGVHFWLDTLISVLKLIRVVGINLIKAAKVNK